MFAEDKRLVLSLYFRTCKCGLRHFPFRRISVRWGAMRSRESLESDDGLNKKFYNYVQYSNL